MTRWWHGGDTGDTLAPQLVGIVLARVLLRQVKDQVWWHHGAEPWR